MSYVLCMHDYSSPETVLIVLCQLFHYGFMQVPSVPNQPKTAEIPAKTHPKCIKNAHRVELSLISDIDISINMSFDIDIDIKNVDIDILELGCDPCCGDGQLDNKNMKKHLSNVLKPCKLP